MATGLSDIVAAMQNGVRAVNGLGRQFSTLFPQVTSMSTAVRGSDGTITFDSSLAVSFIAVKTSSGFVGWVPTYLSS
jgi:hypothetical protein